MKDRQLPTSLLILTVIVLVSAQADGKEPISAAQTEAIRQAETYAREHPADSRAQMKLGEACHDADMLPCALAAYQRAVMLDSLNVAALTNLGIVYRDSERPDSARLAFDRALRLAPGDAEIITHRAIAFQDLGETSAAVEGFRRALAIDPRSAIAHFHLGVSFAKASIFREAIREWETVIAIDSTTAAAKQAVENIRVARGLLGEE